MTSNALVLTTIDETYRMAKGLVMSGLLPKSVNTPEKAFAIITLGAELGFAAWQSINSIDVIQGKPTLKPQAMLALILKSGLAAHIDIPDVDAIAKADAATVTMTRKDGFTHSETFTWEMAKLMETTDWTDGNKKTIPLIEKYNWRTMPEIMMKWRAVSACARVVFPDVIMGMYTSDELDADSIRVINPEDDQAVTFDMLDSGSEPDSTPAPNETPLISKDDAKRLTEWAFKRYKKNYTDLCQILMVDDLTAYRGDFETGKDDVIGVLNATPDKYLEETAS